MVFLRLGLSIGLRTAGPIAFSSIFTDDTSGFFIAAAGSGSGPATAVGGSGAPTAPTE